MKRGSRLQTRARSKARSNSKVTKQGTLSKGVPVSFSSPITLLTDFGTTDYYVGAVKGVILSANPNVHLIDLTHELPAQDIEAAAFVLLGAYKTFPKGTIHVVVVDPGVGSSRRAIVAQAGGHVFVGPDNGVFSFVFDEEPDYKIHHIIETKYFRQPLSQTFHGRDVFAPVAAAISTGVAPESFGPGITDEVRLPSLQPEHLRDRSFKGRIIHIDRFGNCVTNLKRTLLDSEKHSIKVLRVKGKEIRRFHSFYSEEESRAGLFAIWGSLDFLEISARNRSAAKILNATRGDSVWIEF